MSLREKIPPRQQIAPVYSLVVTVLYTWTLISFFWRVSSWLLYFSVGKIITLYAYAVVVNLLESLLVLGGLILLTLILPKKWLAEHFVSRGTLMLVFCFTSLAYFDSRFMVTRKFPAELLIWTPAVPVVAFILAYLLGRVRLVARLAEPLAERMIIFLYIFIPVSLLSILVVGLRNLF